MKKVELLSPVGNKEMLYYAIHNGADAVYLSGKNYGARKFASNFTNEELMNAINYAHTYGVKVYVTVNTLTYEEELDSILEYIGFLYQNQVDALIIQDIGLIKKVREYYPNLELHASTQCHTNNKEAASFFQKLGLKRVVLAREMSLEEIKKIDIPIEKEVFVYGALCVCYSGCCLFSSLNGGRSGNRGECVGSCRLPYQLIKNNEVVKTDGQYLLSTKELNTLPNLKELLDANIDSLKIEGRMKSPSYVGYVTRLYRTLIDKYYNNEPLTLTKEEQINLKKLYNREFTKGYLFHESDIMNIKTPNHQGIPVGKVLSTTKDKIKIKVTNDSLNQGDGIRFQNNNTGMIINRLYDDKNLLKNSISSPHIAYVENTKHIHGEDIILKTTDFKLTKSLEQVTEKKIPIDIYFEARKNKQMSITIKDDKNKVEVLGNIPELAINRSTTQEEVEHQLNKLGNTPYKASLIEVNIDTNLFINIKSINELRRKAVQELTSKRIHPHQISSPSYTKKQSTTLDKYPSQDKINISILTRNETQLKCALENQIDTIYTTDYNLYNTYKDYNNIYYRLPRIINTHPNLENENLLITEIGSLNHYQKNNHLISDYTLNITNHNSIELLTKNNVKKVTLSVELTDNQIKNIMKTNYPAELIIYGRLELMVMKYCPLKKCLNYCKNCKDSKDKFYLEDKEKNRYPMLRENCITHILHKNITNKIPNIYNYISYGIKNFRIELFNEDYNEVENLIKKVREEINNTKGKDTKI